MDIETTSGLSRRERTRAATIAEIKAVALRLMRASGTTDVRFSDIAREMGMTAPGLYRYFSGSEELLTALIVDAYDDLGAAVAAAREGHRDGSVWDRMLAIAGAYRTWARQQPQQFALIFGMPVPGFCAPDEGPTTEAAKRAMGQLQMIFLEAAEQGQLRAPMLDTCADEFAAAVDEKHEHDHLMPGAWDRDRTAVEHVLTPVHIQAMLVVWANLHGFITLDTYGHFDWLGPEAREALFVAAVRQAARGAGLPTDC